MDVFRRFSERRKSKRLSNEAKTRESGSLKDTRPKSVPPQIPSIPIALEKTPHSDGTGLISDATRIKDNQPKEAKPSSSNLSNDAPSVNEKSQQSYTIGSGVADSQSISSHGSKTSKNNTHDSPSSATAVTTHLAPKSEVTNTDQSSSTDKHITTHDAQRNVESPQPTQSSKTQPTTFYQKTLQVDSDKNAPQEKIAQTATSEYASGFEKADKAQEEHIIHGSKDESLDRVQKNAPTESVQDSHRDTDISSHHTTVSRSSENSNQVNSIQASSDHNSEHKPNTDMTTDGAGKPQSSSTSIGETQDKRLESVEPRTNIQSNHNNLYDAGSDHEHSKDSRSSTVDSNSSDRDHEDDNRSSTTETSGSTVSGVEHIHNTHDGEKAATNNAEVSERVQRTAEESALTKPNAQTTKPTKTSSVGKSLDQGTTLLTKKGHYNPIADVVIPPKKPFDNGEPATRQQVEKAFEQYAQTVHATNQPLPSQTGDRFYHKSNEPTGILADIKNLGFRDLRTVRRILHQKASGEPQDDRKYLMEAVMQLVAALPENSDTRVDLSSSFIDELWNTLDHPPQSYLGDDFKYRAADGSRNNYTLPKLGAANTPYARSINPTTLVPGSPPDPFLLFDSLMARDKFKPNPNRISSVFFNFASIVIHDLFQTDHKDPSLSKTSSYLDLSVLYGDTQEDQDTMRTFKDGKLKPDCFAEERLLAFPPTAGVMIILFNRFHNYVVEQLALINEHGRFTKPADHLPEDRKAAAWKKYDNDLFQTGRLVTCGLYINIILYDYLRTIVNLNRTNSTWTLDPRLERPKNLKNANTPRGCGNQVSAEFALAYRWHAGVGELDEAWTEQIYLDLFGKSPGEVDMKELMIGLAKYDHELPDDPHERPFANLKRGPDGKFDDDDLATIMVNATEQVAGAFGALNHPKSLRAITAMGILQARSWNLCTLNEYRGFFGLKKFETFEEINSDPYVAEQLRNLYEHPDYVEIYPGIMVEEAKEPMVPGVGICPNHTIARAVLSDAVALVRGDRFYTIDYSPKNLTSWGWNEMNYDLKTNQGCVFYKLLLRGLPNHFKPDSIYAHYPMTVPDENAKIMKDLGRFHDYNWEKPKYMKPAINVGDYAHTKELMQKSIETIVSWDDGDGYVIGGDRSCFGDTMFQSKQRLLMQDAIYRDKWLGHVKTFYQNLTLKLIQQNSVKIAGIHQVDIIRDVSNMSHTHFAATIFNLPLRSEENPKGIFDEHELWMAICVIFSSVFFDFDPSKTYPLKQASKKLATMIGYLIEADINGVKSTSLVSRLFDNFRGSRNALAQHGVTMLHTLTEAGMSAHDMAFTQIMPAAVDFVPYQSQMFAEVLDYYLGEGKEHWPKIKELAVDDCPETDEILLKYVQEGMRLNGTVGTYRQATTGHTFEQNGKKVHVQPDDKIFCSFVGARNPKIFPEPEKVVLDRPQSAYVHFGVGDFLGKQTNIVALAAMLRTVASLPNTRRAPGPQGELKKVPRPGGAHVYMTERHDSYFEFPTTMKIHFDAYKTKRVYYDAPEEPIPEPTTPPVERNMVTQVENYLPKAVDEHQTSSYLTGVKEKPKVVKEEFKAPPVPRTMETEVVNYLPKPADGGHTSSYITKGTTLKIVPPTTVVPKEEYTTPSTIRSMATEVEHYLPSPIDRDQTSSYMSTSKAYKSKPKPKPVDEKPEEPEVHYRNMASEIHDRLEKWTL